MKEERMAVLRMLEKGIITAAEAERLLLALRKHDDKDHLNMDRLSMDEISTGINSALEKAGEALGSLVATVGEKAEDAKKEMEPIIKKVANTVVEKAEDVRCYAEKVKKDIMEEKERQKEQARQAEEEKTEEEEETAFVDLEKEHQNDAKTEQEEEK